MAPVEVADEGQLKELVRHVDPEQVLEQRPAPVKMLVMDHLQLIRVQPSQSYCPPHVCVRPNPLEDEGHEPPWPGNTQPLAERHLLLQ